MFFNLSHEANVSPSKTDLYLIGNKLKIAADMICTSQLAKLASDNVLDLTPLTPED